MSSPDLCKVQVIIYGAHKKRESMRLHLSVPVNLNRVRADSCAHQGFIMNTVMSIQNEVKHSARWGCFSCGEEAHEFIHSPASYIQKPDPFVVDFVHAVCCLGGACRRAVERENRAIAAETGAPWQDCLAPARDVPSKEPLASSCAICHSTGPVQTCSRCKTIRYCGTACQRRDFSRHKTICKMVTKVEKNFHGIDVDGL